MTTDYGLRPIETQTVDFLTSPNPVLADGDLRLRCGLGVQGVEFFSFPTVRALFRDRRLRPRTPQLFLDLGLTEGPVLDYLVEGNLDMMWTPDHDRLRPIMTKGFRPARIEAARSMIRTIAEELVDEIASMGHCNIVADFSHHLSIRTIARFIGVPAEDVHRFEEATVELRMLGQVPLLPGIPRLEHALRTVYDYTEELVRARQQQPANDFVSDLVAAQRSGDSFSETELIWNVAGVLLAGHDTTRYQLASCLRLIVENGAWEALGSSPEQIPAAIREAMRIYPATPRQPKVVTDDIEIEGRSFASGDVVTLNMVAAGRDPDSFPDPDRMVLDRSGEQFDIGYGHGSHYCLGWAVAQAEMEEGLAVLLRRLTDVQIVGAIEVKPTGVIAGPEVIPITFRERPAGGVA